MRWFTWKRVAATAAAFVAGIGYAAGRGERMPAPDYVDRLLADLPAAAERIEPHSPAREAIEAGRLDEAREMLSFRPFREAPLPEGFPSFTPVGVIEVKRYPAYRKAVGPNFWKLFEHISTQQIPMTTPVEMADATSARGDGEMAFLYQSTSVGSEGPVDGVEVTDTPASLAAAIGVRGEIHEQRVGELRERLEAWLADQTEYRAAPGEAFRLFGYNSPMVPRGERYGEAHLLIERVAE